jgi:2-keto-4-pentenoate hydratase/2-oxohepta-3-ene-1,7-dioic acid hydratase in catechol pathway
VRLARYVDGDGAVWAGVLGDEDQVVPFARGDASAAGAQAELLEAAMAQQVPDPVGPAVSLASVRLLAPVGVPPSIRDFYAFEEHVATARRTRGMEMDPDWYELPVFYFTNPAAVRGPGDDIAVPAGSEALDYELEAAAVIGVECTDVDPSDWLDVVAGFTVMNDWSARDLQAREMRQGLGPAKGKDFATSLGPVLVTPDELPGAADGRPHAAMTARVDGVEWSRGHLGSLHFTWGQLVAHASRSTSLRPGDVIGSGTVGTGCILELSLVHGSDRYPWLQPGQVVELEIDGIGTLRNQVVA